jgi:hypothetical protein
MNKEIEEFVNLKLEEILRVCNKSSMSKRDVKNVECLRNNIHHKFSRQLPPTQEDVCKALSDELNLIWNYTNEFKSVKLICKGQNRESFVTGHRVLVSYEKNKIYFFRHLPPHLIALIGLFYENLEANNE